MINLVYLKIENFLSIESMELNFPKPGNYIITGYNEIGGDSNGSGKSTILNAIIWALFHRTARGLSGPAVTRWGSSQPAKVTLRFTSSDRKDTYEITRTPEEINLYVNGTATSGHKRDIQSTINDTFRTNYDLFLSSVMFTKGQADFLTDSGDAAKKRLFKGLLRLEQIDKMYDRAKELHTALKTQASSMETELAYNKSRIDSLNTEIESFEIKKAGWEVRRLSDIETYKTQLQEQTPHIDASLEARLEEKATIIAHLDRTTKANKDKEASVQEELSSLYRSMGHYETVWKELTAELDSANELTSEKICPYCGAPITKRSLASHTQEKEEARDKIQASINETADRIHKLESTFLSMQKTEEEMGKVLLEYNSLLTLVAVQKQKIQEFENTKQRTELLIQQLEKEENPYTTICQSKLQELSVCFERRALQESNFTSILKTIDIYGYIKWVLSREGVVGVIIEKTFNRLEALINYYLSAICTEGFFISIKPQKELKSGVVKDEIEIVITQNGKKIPYAALSGGQEQRVTIAALLALYKLSKEMGMNRFNFLLLDEVLDLSLAEKGQQDIIKLLGGMEEEIRNVFVISHKDNMASEFPFQIDLRRDTDGVTKLIGVYQ